MIPKLFGRNIGQDLLKAIVYAFECAIERKNQLFLQQCKSIRATFLYLNKNKKIMFGFNNKTSSFWNTVSIRKKTLIVQSQNNKQRYFIRKFH